ncbi:HNH endonuclease [Tenacibaculum finnmarkense]|uniref:HNH endonuclease family protein n=1 Tax=Tenacibaculum finnmarkense TaxID=2781243 RepID=UPI003510099A|nr:HNH endonuclease [Tenacibaculum finnmarkense]
MINLINSKKRSTYFRTIHDAELKRSLQGNIRHKTSKFLLWKYENSLESKGKNGYTPTRFDKIINPELEHIAPQTENPEKGYDTYDEKFINESLNCLGNYLLVSKSHNCSVGNKPFIEKRDSYKHSEQQREIQEITKEKSLWTKENIQYRKDKITSFLMENV